jgi:hypothetical protein
LLILVGKIVFADRAADAVERVERLALAMQRLGLPVYEGSRSGDRLDLV